MWLRHANLLLSLLAAIEERGLGLGLREFGAMAICSYRRTGGRLARFSFLYVNTGAYRRLNDEGCSCGHVLRSANNSDAGLDNKRTFIYIVLQSSW